MSREDEAEINIAELKSYETWLRGLAWRILGNSDDVDDVVQDVWLANLRQNGPRSPSRAWLGAVTRNLSATRIRRKIQRVDIERKAAREEELDDNVQSALERVSLYKELLQWILEMEEPYRETLLLRYARNLKLREVARLMDVPESTARVRLQRGHALLQRKARAQYNEERRHQLIWILFGADASRPIFSLKTLAALTLLAVSSLVYGIWSFAREDDRALTMLSSNSPVEEGPTRTEPERYGEPAIIVEKAIESAPELVTGHEVRGRIQFLRGGILHPCQIQIEALPYMVGQAMLLPAMRPKLPGTFEPYESSEPTRVANGETFRIPVKEAGRYRLMVSIAGVQGVLQYWSSTAHWTNAAQTPPANIELLDGIVIHHEPRDLGRYALKWREKTGGVERDLVFESGLARVEGLFMPRLHFQWTDSRNEQVWSREINESDTTIRMPEFLPSPALRLQSAESNHLIRDAQLSLVYWGQDSIFWQSWMKVRDPLHPDFHLPESLGARMLTLTADAEGSIPLELDLTRVPIPEVLRVRPIRTVSGQVIGRVGANEPVLSIIAVRDQEPVLIGQSSGDGSFTLEPVPSSSIQHSSIEEQELTFWIFGENQFYGRCDALVRDNRVLIDLPQKKTFQFIVQDSRAERLPEAKMVVLPWDERPISQLLIGERLSANENAEIVFGGVRGGSWFVDVQAEGYESQAMVIPWESTPETPVVIQLKTSERVLSNIQVLDSHGEPLPYASVSLGGTSAQHPMELQTDDLGKANISFNAQESQTFDVSYPGYALSLGTPLRTSGSVATTTVVMMPIVEKRCLLSSAGDDPIWIRCRSFNQPAERSRILRYRPGEDLPLTDEAQRLEIYQRGHHPLLIKLDDSSRTLTFSLVPGPRLSLVDCGYGDEITLSPESLPGDLAASAARVADFQLKETAHDATLEWPSVLPGNYKLQVVTAQNETWCAAITINADSTISLAELYLDR